MIKRWHFIVTYQVVLLLVNVLGTFFTLFMAPIMLHPEIRGIYLAMGASVAPLTWLPDFIAFPLVLTIFLPTVVQTSRAFDPSILDPSQGLRWRERFINLPLFLSLIGFAGWMFTFVFHLVLVGITGVGGSNGVLQFTWSLPLYISTGGIVLVATYYILDALNRMWYIPFLFNDNKLSHIQSKRLTLRSRFFVLYFAVVFNPLLITGSALSVAHQQLGGPELSQRLITTGIILVALFSVSLFLTMLFSQSLSRPLEKMANMVDHIAQGKFELRVPVVTTDEAGRLGEGLNAMAEGLQEREALRKTFGQMVDPRVRDLLMDTAFDGSVVRVSILFLDIRGFTTLSEGRDPQWVVSLLNRLFDIVTREVEAQGGLVNKFMGDAVLAIFGAPSPLPQHQSRAVHCAFSLLEKIKKLGKELESEGIEALKVGIGVHTGEVLAGRIGGGGRMEYSVIGDAVNLASRLESATKKVHSPLLVSFETWKDLVPEEQSRLVSLGQAMVRGRSEAVGIYGIKPT